MPNAVLLLVVMLLLPAGAAAQTPRPAGGAFYAGSRSPDLSTRFFGTVSVREDSVEVIVSEGSVTRPGISFVSRPGA